MRFVFIFLSFLFLASCNEQPANDNASSTGVKKEKQEKGTRPDYQVTQEEANAIRERDKERARIATENSAKQTQNQSQTSNEDYQPQTIPLSYLEKYVGNYPSAINFLGNTALRSRMNDLMGKEAFPEAVRIWKQETPLEIQSGLIFTTAQEGPADNDPKLALMVDVGRDLLFVAVKNFETVGEQTFAERNADIPVRLKNWIEKK